MAASKFQHNLARLRKHLGLSQFDVAKLADCSKTTIQSIELGRLSPSKALVAKLQGALGVPADWLFSKDLDSPIPEPLRLFQDGQVPYKFKFHTMEHIAHFLKIQEGLSNERDFALFDHYLFECLKAMGKSFPLDYPAKTVTGFRAIETVAAFVEELKRQHPASLPQRKAKPVHRSKRSRTRPSA